MFATTKWSLIRCFSSLVGFSGFPDDVFPFPWHVHEYPFPHDGTVTPCGEGITGDHFDPLGASRNLNYSTDCSPQAPQNCEVGDLSGKFEHFPKLDPLVREYSDRYLSLYGVNSIIGRSIVIHFVNASRLVCANIGYPTPVPAGARGRGLLYSPFRNEFKGDIFFRQHTPDGSTSSVFTNLVRVVGDENSFGHNWHVHDRPLDPEGRNCSLAGPHYNPRGVNISDPSYPLNCGNMNATQQRNCEIGDLSNKGAPFTVVSGRIQQFYTDTDLPLVPDVDGYSIDNRSTVIHEANLSAPRIDCANLTEYQPLEAVSIFNDLGVSGSVRFYQRSPYDPTQVTVNLSGLRQMADGYQVHEYPVGPAGLESPARCGEAFTGDQWNPTNVSGLGTTSDQLMIGDLSGKFGSLSGLNEISAVFTEPNVPLFGPFSVIGRSIVIREIDGTRWVCSDIKRAKQVLEVTATFSTPSFSGNVTFSQPADDPYAETTITVEVDVIQMLQPPPLVVSTSTPVDVTPSTNVMTTSTVTMTTIGIATSNILESTMITMPAGSVTMTTSSASSLTPVFQPSLSSSLDLPTSFTSRQMQPEPTAVSSPAPSPLTYSVIDIGSADGIMLPFIDEESTGKSDSFV